MSTLGVRVGKRQKAGVIAHDRFFQKVGVTTVDELVYKTAERKQFGIMRSELDELGTMICRRAVKENRVTLYNNTIYTLTPAVQCSDEKLRVLWIASATEVQH
jgi:hypothetical protein